MKCKVRLEPAGKEYEVAYNTPLRDILLQHGFEFPCGGRGVCGNCKVQVLSGHIKAEGIHAQMLEAKRLDRDWRLACYSYITEDVTLYIKSSNLVVTTDHLKLAITPEEGLGIAVDLGSTTIVSQLVNLSDGYVISTATSPNPQSQYGADIISRISYALSSQTNAACLCQIVRNAIYKQINQLLTDNTHNVRKVVIVGNTVMHHLFCGFNVAPLSVFPFQSEHNEGKEYQPADLGWQEAIDCPVWFMPNLGHFVGSDILAGIEAIQMYKQERFQALIDLGTNGEIAIGNKERIVYTSTAAGPAFEGINISQGMKASEGAIYQINETNGNVQTIGNTKPVGICGSGLIEVVHWLLKKGEVDCTGTTANNQTFLPIYGEIGLTDKDIREFQLAKAATRTGMDILLQKANLSYNDIEHIYISGGLGNYLNIEKAISVGLFSNECLNKVIRIGNSALHGAKMFLFDTSKEDMRSIANITEYCALELQPDFQDIYCDNLLFP